MAAGDTSFDADAYNTQYGPTLSGLASGQSGQGAFVGGDPNMGSMETGLGSGGGQASPQSNVAPMPSPMQQARMFQRQRAVRSARNGSALGGNPPPSSGQAFYDPNGSHMSPPVYDAVDNMSAEQVKAHEQDLSDKVAAGQDQHGHPDLQSVFNSTFKKQLTQRAADANLDNSTAAQITKPSWRDSMAMFLDAANRAGSIHAQNPAMSKGDIWAVATRGAMDGWMAHVQGQHDAYLQQQQQIRAGAKQDALDAVKRSTDTFGLQDKADTLLLNQRKADETARHNKAMEGIDSTKAATEKTKTASEGKKGDLVTGDDGYLYRVDPQSGKASPVTDDKGQPVKGTKTGVNPPKADGDTLTKAKASDLWEKYLEKYTAKPGLADMKKSRAQLESDAKKAFQSANPDAYKVVFGDDPDLSAPPPRPDDNTPPSLRKKK